MHETRKALKRLRALMRLLDGELGGGARARENAVLRDAARSLSGARDAAVMLSTLDALMTRHPRKLGRRRAVLDLRRRLRAEHARVERDTLADPGARAEVLGELHALRWRVGAWSLSDRDGIELIEADLERLYRQGRTRYRRVARGKGDRMIAMHEWRKRVKDLRYAAEMLGQRQLRRPCARWRLGELLGEEHDLAVLAARVRAGGLGGRRADRDVVHGQAHTRAPAEADRQAPAGAAQARAAPRQAPLPRRAEGFVKRVRAAYARDARLS